MLHLSKITITKRLTNGNLPVMSSCQCLLQKHLYTGNIISCFRRSHQQIMYFRPSGVADVIGYYNEFPVALSETEQ